MIAMQFTFDANTWYLVDNRNKWPNKTLPAIKYKGRWIRLMDYANEAIDLTKMAHVKNRVTGYCSRISGRKLLELKRNGKVVTKEFITDLLVNQYWSNQHV